MECSIHRFFAQAEVNQLESGLPRLSEWSSALLVPFEARQLRHASVLWINARWFLERLLDVTREETRHRVASWLLDEFAYVVPQPSDPPGAFTDIKRTLHADRYGSSTGRTVHGGSGRVATVGCYQAKGVGVTPLVGEGGDPEHATGHCSVEEGIREAIYAEVAAAEFPHGAVPTVAILDTGLYFQPRAEEHKAAHAGEPIRRALVIRPAVLRIAHAERAPLFIRSLSGAVNSQLEDTRRTRDVIERWSSKARAANEADIDAPPLLPQLISRIAEQVAFGQVHRLFSGGYFSSNLSVTGALLDFGGMRALPNWVNARNLDTVVGFGDEMKLVHKLIESMGFYFNKYRGDHASSPPSASALRAHAEQAYTSAFTQECVGIFALDPHSDPALTEAITRALRRYFLWQQRLQINYKRSAVNEHRWLYDSLARRETCADRSSLEAQTIDAIRTALEQRTSDLSNPEPRLLHAWGSAKRYLMPREALDREKLKHAIECQLANGGQLQPTRDWIASFVRTAVSQGRRHWPALPSNLTVQAHVAYEGSSALWCTDRGTGNALYWLEGIRTPDGFRLFDADMRPEQARDIGAQFHGVKWTACVSISDLHRTSSLQIPEPHVCYSAVSST